jgi:small-conductance mechanosensitive channel
MVRKLAKQNCQSVGITCPGHWDSKPTWNSILQYSKLAYYIIKPTEMKTYLLLTINFPLKDLLTYLIIVAATFVVLYVSYQIINKLVKRWEKESSDELIYKLRLNLRLPVILLISILSIWLPFLFVEMPEVIAKTANKILSILLIIVIAWVLIRLVKLIKHLVLRQYDIEQKDNLTARRVYTQFRIIERILIFLILIIAISLVLMTFSEIRRIGVSLITSAGVTGIILGLAAQKLIAGVLSGIQLAITQPIRIDDVVVVENEWGRIEEINLTYVVVKIWDERRLVLPSSYFIEKPFQNWTRTNSDIMGTVFIYTDYNVPFDELRSELTRLLNESDLWDKKVNVLQVTNATEKTVEIRALVSAENSGNAWDLRVYIREQLIKFLQEKYPESLPKSRVEISNAK